MSFLRCGGGLPWAFRPRTPKSIASVRHSIPLRKFHAASTLWGIKSQVLKDVGEGELDFFSSPVLLGIYPIFDCILMLTDSLSFPQVLRRSRSYSGMLRRALVSRNGSPFASINQTRPWMMLVGSLFVLSQLVMANWETRLLRGTKA